MVFISSLHFSFSLNHFPDFVCFSICVFLYFMSLGIFKMNTFELFVRQFVDLQFFVLATGALFFLWCHICLILCDSCRLASVFMHLKKQTSLFLIVWFLQIMTLFYQVPLLMKLPLRNEVKWFCG